MQEKNQNELAVAHFRRSIDVFLKISHAFLFADPRAAPSEISEDRDEE